MKAHITPKKKCYVNFHLLSNAIMFFVMAILIYLSLRCTVQLREYAIYPPILLWFLIMLYSLVARPIHFRKEAYILDQDRIITKGGGIFSNYERELLVKNITHVSFSLPYFENKYHQTGNIRIQSAGGAGVEVQMQSLDSPKDAYLQITNILQNNGFSLTKKEKICKASPHYLGIMLHGAIILLFVFIGLSVLCQGLPAYFGLSLNFNCIEFYILLGINLSYSFLASCFTMGKMKNTVYTLYNDAIVNESSFFGYQKEIIPIENLSDSTIKQNIIARILGISDLVLSCQGGGQHINFQFITNASKWKQNLDALLQNKPLVSEQESLKTEAKGFESKGVLKKSGASERDSEYTAQLQMSKKRIYLPCKIDLVLGIIFMAGGIFFLSLKGIPNNQRDIDPFHIVIFIVLAIAALLLLVAFLHFIIAGIIYRANKYYVREKGFGREFKFFNTQNNEYNTEKITGVIASEGILDRWVKTCSIKFWSIGSNQSLEFKSVAKTDEFIEKILNKTGIYTGKQPHLVTNNITIENFFKDHMFSYIALFIIFFGTILSYNIIWAWLIFFLVCAIPLSFAKWYYGFQKLELYTDYLIFYTGIFNKKKYYVRYHDIKHVEHKCYPFSLSGSLIVNITGEQLVQQGDSKVLKSNSFTMGHLENIDHLHITLGLLIEKKINNSDIPDLEYNIKNHILPTFITSKPKVKQFLIARGIFIIILDVVAIGGAIFYNLTNLNNSIKPSWIIFITIAINVLFFFFMKIYIGKFSYSIDEEKVTKHWGVFYKRKMTLHYIDIDYISKKQGFFNNMCKTANIDIHTVGSSKTDMVLYALEDHENFYEILKTGYQSHTK